MMLSFILRRGGREVTGRAAPNGKRGPPRVHLEMQLRDSVLCAPWGPQQGHTPDSAPGVAGCSDHPVQGGLAFGVLLLLALLA